MKDGYYRLAIVDSEVENWLKTASNKLPKPWKLQERFRDFGLRAFIRPVTKDTFNLATEGHTYIDDLNPANLIRVVEHWVKVMWLLAKDGNQSPSDFFKGSNLDSHSRKVVFGLAGDFPHLFKTFERYFTIENIVSGKSTEVPIRNHLILQFGSTSIHLKKTIRILES